MHFEDTPFSSEDDELPYCESKKRVHWSRICTDSRKMVKVFLTVENLNLLNEIAKNVSETSFPKSTLSKCRSDIINDLIWESL